jgi:hypothetical protein
MKMVDSTAIASTPEPATCVHCGKTRSRHHVRRSDGYSFLACQTLDEIRREHVRGTYYQDVEAALRQVETYPRSGASLVAKEAIKAEVKRLRDFVDVVDAWANNPNAWVTDGQVLRALKEVKS